MFKSKKIAATVAGILGGFALIGAGALQAVGAEGSGECTEDVKGNVRCVQVNEQRITRGEDGKVHLDQTASQDCSGSGGELSCVSSVVLGDRES
ncbi:MULTISPECIES: hypothetical protein [Streptomyces]|uniref:hypothetical protein n=1 Tax=Streptomyces TaxID=1883 RepID=UPI000D6720D8|nr:hypothetical protein [Streptomyces sp. NWU49]PWJ07343.1 hypothetical protein DKG34_12275 [Streptomyces sp. NWU49]